MIELDVISNLTINERNWCWKSRNLEIFEFGPKTAYKDEKMDLTRDSATQRLPTLLLKNITNCGGIGVGVCYTQ